MALLELRRGVILYLGALVVVTGITHAGYQAPPPPQDMLAGSVVIIRDTKPCPVRGSSCQCGCVAGEPCRCAVAAPSPAPIVVASPSRPIVHTSTILPPVSYTVAPVLSYPQPVQVAPPVQYAPVYPSTPQYTPAYFGSSWFGGGYCAGGG